MRRWCRYSPGSPQQSASWAIAPLAGFICAAIAATLAWPAWAADLHSDYYVVIASVIPVLLLALMLETASIMSVDVVDRVRRTVADAHERVEEMAEQMGSELGDAQHRLADVTRDLQRVEDEAMEKVAIAVGRLRWTVRGFFVAAVAGEVASLYAVASETSTPFLFVLSAVEALSLVVMIAIAFELRFAVDH